MIAGICVKGRRFRIDRPDRIVNVFEQSLYHSTGLGGHWGGGGVRSPSFREYRAHIPQVIFDEIIIFISIVDSAGGTVCFFAPRILIYRDSKTNNLHRKFYPELVEINILLTPVTNVHV